jgi:hypothetical protein
MANDKPVTRKERFLAGAAGEDITLDTPITRGERFLAKAAGMDVKTDDPVTRSEKYLAKIAEGGGGGGSVPEYTGSYAVTPSEQTQTLSTKDKKATANITVNPIPSNYIVPTGTKQITQNGTGIDVAAYADVDVNVPTGITPTGTIQITQNGQVDVTDYASADVNVSGGDPWDEEPPEDGKTRIYITLGDGNLKPYLGIAVNGSYTIDWGDGSAVETKTGSSDYGISEVLFTQHEYHSAGKYIITVSVAGSAKVIGWNNSAHLGSSLLSNNISTTSGTSYYQNNVYHNAVKKIYFGDNISCGTNGLGLMEGLVKVKGLVASGNGYQYWECHSLQNGDVPVYNKKILPGVFYHCFSIGLIEIPSEVSDIKEDAFNGCNLSEMTFKPATPPNVSASSAFSNIPTKCKFYIPYASLASYVAPPTNYPSPSTYTHIGFATYANGTTLPTQDTTAAYNVVWYATKADAIVQANPITVGNGNEIYCRYTAV